ncbi:MAG: SDR family NAD(P)-dependent oxidoreductase [Pseudomonadota bacterium]
MTTRPPYNALIFGASGGIGASLVALLRSDPNCMGLETLSRRDDGVDLCDEDAVAAVADRMAGRSFDLIFNAAGVLSINGADPEKAFREINPKTMASAFSINAIGAALLLKHFLPLLRKDGRAVFTTLSARVGSIGDNRLGGWISYRASKAALNQIVRCASIEENRRNKDSIVVALHPGTVKTPLTEKYARGRYTAEPPEAAAQLLGVCADLTPEQSGGFYDYAGKAVDW